MKFLTSKLSKYLYIAVCAIIFTQLITGYSLTIKYINTILIVILFSYPLIIFLIAQIPAWLKVLVVLTIVGAIILIANNVLILLAFGTESETKMKSWKLNNIRVVLTKRQGWSGPPYLQYDLVDLKLFGLFGKTIAYGYPDTIPCKITFEKKNNGISFEFDTCKNHLLKFDKTDR